MNNTPKVHTHKLRFHQMHQFEPEAFSLLSELVTKYVSVPQVQASGLGLRDRRGGTPTALEYIRLIYKQSTAL